MKKIERLLLWQETPKGKITTVGAYRRKDYCIVKTSDLDQLEREREELRTALLRIRANIRNISTDPEADDNYNIAVDVLNKT